MEISVVMPVYNCGEYLEEAIDSILAQTFTDFELLVIDDGSTDDTAERVVRYTDTRIRLLRNGHDFIASLNLGLEKAKGKYVARMDSDDVMVPQRLYLQYKAMEEHPDVAVCASWVHFFGNDERNFDPFSGCIPAPLVYMLKGNIIAHSSVMLRNSFLREHALQYEEYPYAEDYKLWCRVAMTGGRFWMEPSYLLNYRTSDGQVCHRKSEEQRETTFLIRNEVLDYLVTHAGQEQTNVTKLSVLIYDLNDRGMLSEETCFDLFFDLFVHMYRV